MKTIAKSIIIIAAMLLCNSCTRVVYVLPEKITVSGQVTDKDGQPWEGVLVEVTRAQFMGMTIPVEGTYTDENGIYEVSFKPNKDNSYGISFETTKDDYFYYQSRGLDLWTAEQEQNVVLKRHDE